MTGQNLSQINAIKELANQYSMIPEQYLLQAFGREATLEEFAAFMETSAANILGRMYDILRESKSPQEADAWLRQTLGLTSALVRRNGSDAVLKFDVTVKEVPNTLHKKQAPMPEKHPQEVQETVSAPECKCQIDVHGICVNCAGVLASYFQNVYQPFMKMMEMAEKTKGICVVCQPIQTDYAVSTILPGLLKTVQSGTPEERNISYQKILMVLYSMAASVGAQQLPLTDKTYAQWVGKPVN